MNEVFKKAGKEEIILDDNFKMHHDSFRGIILTFSEMREREKVDEKRKKTGEKEEYLFEEHRYFARVDQALERFVELSQNSAKSIEEILEKTDKILAVVEEFKVKFINWSDDK